MEKNINKLSIISHPDLGQVRSVIIKGEPYFVAKDVCDVLGLINSRKALVSLEDDEKGVTTSDTLGGKQEMATVNESGMYSLIFQSRKPEAKVFRKWVTSEVLPAIRRQGFYVHPSARLSVGETRKLERLMVQNVNQYIIADDIRKCSRKFGVRDSYIHSILNGRSVNNDMMLDLQERALVNRQNWSDAYGVERMQNVIKKLNR